MFKRKQKKLTLRQVHELYLLLRHAIPSEEEKYLIDEIEAIVDKLDDKTFKKAIEIMYKKSYGNPIELLLLFVAGLRESNFFEYVAFVRGLHAR